MNVYEFKQNPSHPESPRINHSQDAVYISQYFANFFVSEARKSTHHFPDAATEEKYLIYNYNTYYAGKHGWQQEQNYIFEE